MFKYPIVFIIGSGDSTYVNLSTSHDIKDIISEILLFSE